MRQHESTQSRRIPDASLQKKSNLKFSESIQCSYYALYYSLGFNFQHQILKSSDYGTFITRYRVTAKVD
jgi:hypothetical protein